MQTVRILIVVILLFHGLVICEYSLYCCTEFFELYLGTVNSFVSANMVSKLKRILAVALTLFFAAASADLVLQDND